VKNGNLYRGLSRLELYELVWSKPATAVAKQIGVDKTSVLRVCKRLRIPKPTKAQRSRLARGEKARKPALPSFGLTSGGVSPEEEAWYFTLKPRTRRWLARAKVRSIEQVLQLELHSRIPTSVRRELGDFQYSEQIKGEFDPRTPLNRDDREKRLMHGGLLSGGMHPGEPWSFLSLGEVFDGWVLCARGGSIFLQGFNEIQQRGQDYIADITGFKESFIPRIHRPKCWFGGLTRTGFEKIAEDLALSRAIFGLDYASLQSVLYAYERVTRSSEGSGALKISYANQDSPCQISGKVIPARFPYIENMDVTSVGTKMSLEAFFDFLALLTGDGKKGGRMVRAFEEFGVDPSIWSMIWVRGDIRPWGSWSYARYMELKVRGWQEKAAQIAKTESSVKREKVLLTLPRQA
jgi:hypothetical protein